MEQMFIITLKGIDYDRDIKGVFQIRAVGKSFEDVIKKIEKGGFKDDEILHIAKN